MDVSIYKPDAELIVKAIESYRKSIYDNARTMIVSESEYETIQALDQLRCTMLDRIALGLHPEKS